MSWLSTPIRAGHQDQVPVWGLRQGRPQFVVLSIVMLWAGLTLAQPNGNPPTDSKSQNQVKLCAVLSDAGRSETALPYCERAVKDNPSAENIYLLATVQADLGRFTPSIDNFRRSIGANSSYVQAYIGLARVYIRQYRLADNKASAAPLLEQALSTLKEAERVNPKYAAIYATRGIVYAYQTKYDQAVDALNKSLAIKDEPTVRAALADVYIGQQRWDDAIKNYEQAIQSAPNDASLRVKYGSLLLIRGSIDQAITHLDQAVVLRPGNAEAWLKRGDAYFEKKDWQQAGVSYQQTVALSPVSYPDAYMGLGQVLIEIKEFTKARFNFTKAVALDDGNPTYRFWLCRANELMGDKNGAKVQCEKALKLRPDYAQAKEVLDRLK